MNASQRKYLTDKITEKVKLKIKELESQKEETPDLASYLMHWILSDKFEIRSTEELRETIKQRAIKGLSDARPDNFLGDGSSWSSNTKNKVILKISEFFVLPPDYQEALERANKHNSEIYERIRELSIQAESLETRIMLASDKTLQKMINEVDDMGDISLIDTKIKLLN